MITPSSLRVARLLMTIYMVISILTVVALAVLTATAPQLVNDEAWVRGVILAGTSILTLTFARQAARGRSHGLTRLRVVVAILLVAVIVVLFVLKLPGWMVVEQVVCGALLLATAALVYRMHSPDAPTDTAAHPEP